MRHTTIFICAILSLATASCVKKAYIFKGSEITSITNTTPATAPGVPPPSPTYSIQTQEVSGGKKAKITQKQNYLLLKFDNAPTFSGTPILQTVNSVTDPDKRALAANTYYFPSDINPGTATKTKLTYFTSQFSLQTLAVALRIRKAINVNGTQFPLLTESNVNVGLAPGWKFSINTFNAAKAKTNQYSFTPGVFLSLSATQLDNTNTLNPTISKTQKVPSFTSGLYGMFGFNTVNIGFVCGTDKPFGDPSLDKTWIYNGKFWYGIAVGLSLIK